jgi:hypothetical protein
MSIETEICRDYLSGINYHDINSLYKISPKRLRKLLLDNGLEPRSNKKPERLNAQEKDKAVEMYRSGDSFQIIAKTLGCSTHCIKKSLDENDVIARREWSVKFRTEASIQSLKSKFYEVGSLSGLAKIFGCSRDAVFNGLIKSGLSKTDILKNISFAYESKISGMIFLKSKNEEECAFYLDRHDLIWNYEPETLKFDGLSYLPDFVVYNGHIPVFVIDAKSMSTNFSVERHAKVLKVVSNVYPKAKFVTTNETNVELIIDSISRRV